jgi:hypothetical protein
LHKEDCEFDAIGKGGLAILISSALFVEEDRNHDNGNRQSQQEMNMPVKGIGYRNAKKP